MPPGGMRIIVIGSYDILPCAAIHIHTAIQVFQNSLHQRMPVICKFQLQQPLYRRSGLDGRGIRIPRVRFQGMAEAPILILIGG